MRGLCMIRHEGWKDFRLGYDILTQSDATRPRAKGQIRHPSIKCLFPLVEMTLFSCSLSEYLYIADQFKSDFHTEVSVTAPAQDNTYCYTLHYIEIQGLP